MYLVGGACSHSSSLAIQSLRSTIAACTYESQALTYCSKQQSTKGRESRSPLFRHLSLSTINNTFSGCRLWNDTVNYKKKRKKPSSFTGIPTGTSQCLIVQVSIFLSIVSPTRGPCLLTKWNRQIINLTKQNHSID